MCVCLCLSTVNIMSDPKTLSLLNNPSWLHFFFLLSVCMTHVYLMYLLFCFCNSSVFFSLIVLLPFDSQYWRWDHWKNEQLRKTNLTTKTMWNHSSPVSTRHLSCRCWETQRTQRDSFLSLICQGWKWTVSSCGSPARQSVWSGRRSPAASCSGSCRGLRGVWETWERSDAGRSCCWTRRPRPCLSRWTSPLSSGVSSLEASALKHTGKTDEGSDFRDQITASKMTWN